MWTLAYIAIGVIGFAVVALFGILWFSSRFLNGWSGDPFSHLPEHQQAIERARYEYELGEQLDYPGEVLLGLESKVCAAMTKAEQASALCLKRDAEAAEERREQARLAMEMESVCGGKSADACLMGTILRAFAGSPIYVRS